MNPASSFLAKVPPFDRLPEADIELAARALTKSHQLKDMTLCVQGKTRLRFVYIVIEGVLEQFILENGEKILRSYLHEHSIYGGLSLLFNAGLSIRTVQSIEDSTLYRLPRDIFLDICARHVAFTQHFTTLFSRKMQDRPYVAFIAKNAANDPDAFASGFLNRPLADVFSKSILSCPDQASVQDAAQMMTRKQRSAAAVLDPSGTAVGLITDNDIRSKIVAQDRPHSTKVRDIMSHPLITLPHDAGIFEAILLMMQHTIKHVAVLDASSRLLGIASEEDLLLAQGQSPVFLMHEIRQAASVDELRARHQQLPGLIKSLTENGAKAEHLNRIISAVSDAILQRVIHGVLSEFSPPPAGFAFMLLGSEGRQEQTLKTDQDNAIVFADQTPEREREVQAYFLDLGRTICSRLDRIGYASCEFEIMAENPKWCRPLKSWKNTFQDWIKSADPEALLHSSIFFDFRSGYGDEALVNELKDFLLQSTGGWMGFFRHLAENALHFKPPLDFFGNFALQGKGEHKNCLEIKTPMRLIVDFARIYALKNKIRATNTQERLRAMHDVNILDKEDFEDLYHAYNFMMQARIEHQLRQIGQNKPPDNFLDPKVMTQIERQSLKEAFKRIRMAQGKMRMELTSATGIT